jgi:hypothetical protein
MLKTDNNNNNNIKNKKKQIKKKKKRSSQVAPEARASDLPFFLVFSFSASRPLDLSLSLTI